MALVVARETGQQTFSNTGASTAVSFASLPAAGSLIVVMVAGTVDNGDEYSVNSVTDNQGNTYARRSDAPGAGDGNVEIWSAENIGTPSGTFTVTVDHVVASANYGLIEAYEVTGVPLSGVTEQTTSGGGTPPSDGEFLVELVQARQIIFGGILVLGDGGAISPPANYTETAEAGWTEAASEKVFQAEFCFRIVSTAGQHQPQWSHSDGDWVVAAATFKEALPVSSVRAGGGVTGATHKNAQAASVARAAGAASATDRKNAFGSSFCELAGATTSSVLKGGRAASAVTASAAVTSTRLVKAASSVTAAGNVTTVGIRNRPSLVMAAGAVTSTTRKNASRASALTSGGAVVTIGSKNIERASASSAAGALTSAGRKGGKATSITIAAGAVSSGQSRGAAGTSSVTAAGGVASESRRSRISAGGRVVSAVLAGRVSSSTVRAGARVVSDAFRPFAPSVPIDARVIGGPLVAAQVLEPDTYCIEAL